MSGTITPQELATQIYGKAAGHSRSPEARRIRPVARLLFPEHTKGTHWHLTGDQVEAIRKRL